MAYDPEPAIQRVLDSSKAIYDLWGATPPNNAMDMMFGRQVDRAAMVLIALSKTPDKALAQDAYTHFLSMIEENRRFWSLVALESDNTGEWVPNETQVSGLGLMMPPGTGAALAGRPGRRRKGAERANSSSPTGASGPRPGSI